MAPSKLLRRFHALSLSSKLFLLLLPLTFVPVLAVSAQWYFVTRHQLTEEVVRRLETRWATVEQEIRNLISRKEARIREVAESPLFLDLYGYREYGLKEEADNVRGKIREYFVRLSGNSRLIHRVCLASASGDGLIRVVRGEVVHPSSSGASSLCSRPSGEEGSVRVFVRGPDEEVRDKFLRFSTPLRNPWGNSWAQLSFDVPLSGLANFVQRLPLPEEGVGLILDEQGRVLVCADVVSSVSEEKSCKNRGVLGSVTQLVLADALPHPMARTIDNHVIFLGRSSLPGLSWKLALVVPLERYTRNIRRLERDSLIAGLIFFVVAVAVLLPLSRKATAPLRRLEEHTRKIAEGDFQQKLPALGGDEIGHLARAFNTMVDSLGSRDIQLRQQAETLMARNEELVTLNRVISRAGMTLRLEALLPALLDEILAAMGLKIGVIRLVDETTGLLHLATSRGLAPDYERSPEQIRIGKELTGKVALTGEPIFIQDLKTDPAAAKLLHRVQTEEPFRGYAAVPIVADEKVIGVLALAATGPRTFNQTDLSSLISIGLGIGACIRNARLYRELAEAYERLQSLQEHLIRTEKLSAMGQLVAGVAHEISNPLTTIIGYAQLIQSRMDGDENAEEVRTIIEQTRRCTRVVQKLLAFARETEKQEEVVDLHEILHDVLEPARLNLVLNNVGVSFRGRKGTCITLGDQYQLQQVFLNLITNAQQALEDRPPPRMLKIGLTASEEQCLVTVEDNGPGIEAEVLRKIFDPFFTTKANKKGGTGLGLSVSYGIIKDHGGDIVVESEVGKGTTVKVQLPRVRQGARKQDPGRVKTSPTKGIGQRVLVIDDEPEICKYIQKTLEPLRYEVIASHSVADARKRIREDAPNLILTDIRLADGDGFLLYDEVVRAGEAEPRKFAFMTGAMVNEKTKERLKESGRPYIQKPFEMEEIQRFLDACFKDSRQR